MKTLQHLLACICALTCLAAPMTAAAQSYPAKPIRVILGVAGAGETLIRMMAQKMTEALGQPLVVDVQAGVAGAIAAEAVARAAPDGYTLLYPSSGSMIYRVFLARNTPYDPVRDFTPIARVAEAVLVVAGSHASPLRSFDEVIDFAKRNPGKLFYGSSGVGTVHHLSAELLGGITGINWVHVPYKDAARLTIDLIGGQVPVAFGILGTYAQHVSTGKMRLIAINNVARYSRFPDVPTLVELIPGYEPPPTWNAFFGPAGVPRPIVQRLNSEIIRAVEHPDVRSKLDGLGIVPRVSSPEELGEALRRGLEQAAQIIKMAGISPE